MLLILGNSACKDLRYVFPHQPGETEKSEGCQKGDIEGGKRKQILAEVREQPNQQKWRPLGEATIIAGGEGRNARGAVVKDSPSLEKKEIQLSRRNAAAMFNKGGYGFRCPDNSDLISWGKEEEKRYRKTQKKENFVTLSV